LATPNYGYEKRQKELAKKKKKEEKLKHKAERKVGEGDPDAPGAEGAEGADGAEAVPDSGTAAAG
jgi:hypothetical protein